jgi:hypothetical protein
MRNARLAEWILSLVTTPERASAAVGDLLEDRAHAGALRFWSAVLITTLSLLWRDMTASPLRMARLAGFGFLLQQLMSLGVAAGYWVLFGIFKLTWSTLVSFGISTTWSGRAGFGGIALVGVFGWVLTMLSQFQVGRVLAKRSPGHELAPCVATTLLGMALPILIVLLSSGRPRFPTGQLVREVVFGPAPWWMLITQTPYLLVLLAGAAYVRRRRLSISS